MEQPKISVTTDGEIDVSAIDEAFFKTLLNRIMEIHHQSLSTQPKATTEQENNN